MVSFQWSQTSIQGWRVRTCAEGRWSSSLGLLSASTRGELQLCVEDHSTEVVAGAAWGWLMYWLTLGWRAHRTIACLHTGYSEGGNKRENTSKLSLKKKRCLRLTTSYLYKPHGYECHIVSTEHWADEDFLHPPVEVHLQVLHLLPDEVRRDAAGVGGHSLNAIQLAGVLLPRLLQHGQVVPASARAARLFGADTGDGGEGACSPEVTAQPEQRNIHPKSVGNPGKCSKGLWRNI